MSSDSPAARPQLRALAVRLPNPLGDVVMATPLLRALRQGLPNTRLVAIGKESYGPLLAGLDSLDDFHGLKDGVREQDILRQADVDAILLLPNSWSSAIAAWRAGIPLRIGRHQDGRGLLLHHRLPKIRQAAPMTQLYAEFLPALGLPSAIGPAELVADPADTGMDPADAGMDPADAGMDPADTGMDPANADRPPLPRVGIAPGAAFGPSKCYPKDKLLEVLAETHRQHPFQPVWFGSPQELEQLSALASALPFESILPQRGDLAESKARLHACSVLLAMDNGARHMAAALGTPQVVVYGPTHPAWSAHGLERTTLLQVDDLDCLRCHHKECPKEDHPCMTKLAPQRLVQALLKVLQQ